MLLRAIFSIGLTFAVAGCDGLLSGFLPATPMLAKPRIVAGWEVGCVVDKSGGAQFLCSMSRATDDPSKTRFNLWSAVTIQSGRFAAEHPIVSFGPDLKPGQKASIRVDEGQPVEDLQSPELLRQLRSGSRMVAKLDRAGNQPTTVTMSLDGFDMGYSALRRAIVATRDRP